MRESIQAVFLDRDGTLGGGKEVVYPREFLLYDYLNNAIRMLKNSNIRVLGFTNQPGISRGKVTQEDFIVELKGYGLDEVYICPHTDEDHCQCRKPQIGMLTTAAFDLGLDLSSCVVIGDRWSDMLAADRVGAVKVLVKTGAGNDALEKYRDKWEEVTPDYIADNLLDAVKWLLE